jgi:hypothetical protein
VIASVGIALTSGTSRILFAVTSASLVGSSLALASLPFPDAQLKKLTLPEMVAVCPKGSAFEYLAESVKTKGLTPEAFDAWDRLTQDVFSLEKILARAPYFSSEVNNMISSWETKLKELGDFTLSPLIEQAKRCGVSKQEYLACLLLISSCFPNSASIFEKRYQDLSRSNETNLATLTENFFTGYLTPERNGRSEVLAVAHELNVAKNGPSAVA